MTQVTTLPPGYAWGYVPHSPDFEYVAEVHDSLPTVSAWK